jgi:uncharacterized glyoxalase superfamily protein PhnB
MPATIIPSLRYRNAPAGIEWLCRVFGLRKNLVVPDESGGVAHAQLSFGDGMMMLSSVRDNEWGHFIKQPDEISSAATQSIYLITILGRVLKISRAASSFVAARARGHANVGRFPPRRAHC